MIRVVVEPQQGVGYDLTAEASDLSWSNVRAGGDETASFTLRRSWLDSNPEVKRGATVRITEGLDVLWTGRLEELDRSADDTELMEVSCYGLGCRLRDGLFVMPFIDRDLENFGAASADYRINSTIASFTVHEAEGSPDTDNGLPALRQSFDGEWGTTGEPISLALYDAGEEAKIARVLTEWFQNANVTDANWIWRIIGADADTYSGIANGETEGDRQGVGAQTDDVSFSEPRRYVGLEFFWNGGGSGAAPGLEYSLYWRHVIRVGNHGLALAGDTMANYGLTASQIIGWIVQQVTGVQARRIDGASFAIPHYTVNTPTSHEDAIDGANEFEGAVWGTWGADHVFDRSLDGFFDYRTDAIESQGDWIIRREECDDLDLHDELGSLFNHLKVSWQDAAGEEHVETRTAVVPALEGADPPITRMMELDLGPGNAEAAQKQADVFFGLQGSDPPSRGSLQLTGAVAHRSRGRQGAHRMRADGSTILIPNALANSEAISLGRIDRRTIFPIQRISVSAAETAQPQVTVDLDQTPDRLDVLVARLAAAQPSGGGYSSALGARTDTDSGDDGGGSGGSKKKRKKKKKKAKK